MKGWKAAVHLILILISILHLSKRREEPMAKNVRRYTLHVETYLSNVEQGTLLMRFASPPRRKTYNVQRKTFSAQT